MSFSGSRALRGFLSNCSIRLFGRTPVEPELRLGEVNIIIPNDPIAMRIGMGAPEEGLVLKGTKDLALEKGGAVIYLPLSILELDK